MKKVVLVIIIIELLMVGKAAAKFCNLVGYMGSKMFFAQIDYEAGRMEVEGEIDLKKDIIAVKFSADRSGNVVVYLGQKQKGWDEVYLYGNEGKLIKQIYSGEIVSDKNSISDGNYIVYSMEGGKGGVIKNSKKIMEFEDNCIYKGLSGDYVYITKGNSRGRCFPLYQINMITKEKIKIMDEIDLSSNMEIIHSAIYFEWCHGEGGNRVGMVLKTSGSYLYIDLVGDYCIRNIFGINEKYAFTMCGIVPEEKWNENYDTTLGQPKLFGFETKQIINLTNASVFEGFEYGKCGFDLY